MKSSATVQQMQPLASSTMFSAGQSGIAQPFEDVAIDAERAEFVDHDREAAAAGVADQVADQRGLAGAQKAGDDGDGDL